MLSEQDKNPKFREIAGERNDQGTWRTNRKRSSQKRRLLRWRLGSRKLCSPRKTQGKKRRKRRKKPLKKRRRSAGLQLEFEEHKQQHLRVLAEYDNFRKRTQNEKSAIYHNAVSDTVQALLPIADNIERALEQENASAEDMRKGVEMIENQIQAAFEKLGIRSIGAIGDPFDPEVHNAVAHVEDESLGENVISAVYQKGYLLGDRVVRHAMVQVAN